MGVGDDGVGSGTTIDGWEVFQSTCVRVTGLEVPRPGENPVDLV